MYYLQTCITYKHIKPHRTSRFFSETFYVIAAAAYAKASGDEEAANNARKIFTKCLEYATTPGILPPKFSGERPSIGIGVPMILMNTTL